MSTVAIIWVLGAFTTHIATRRLVVSLKRRQKASGRMVFIKCDFVDDLWISYLSFMLSSIVTLLYCIYFLNNK